MQFTLDRWIRGHARFTPHKIAIRCAGHSLSYAELDRQILRVAAALHGGLGLRRGDRFAVYAMNCPEMFVLLFAAARLGLILVPLNWRLAQPELAQILAGSAPRALFHDDHFAVAAGELAAACGGFPALSLGLDVAAAPPAGASLAALCAEADASLAPALAALDGGAAIQRLAPRAGGPDDPLLIVYTSGTTGSPKGAVLAQRALAANVQMSQHAHDMSSADRVLGMLPLFHVGGLNIQSLPSLALGATLLLHQRFDPAAVLADLDAERISLCLVVPTVLEALLAEPGWEGTRLEALRAFAIGSTDVPLALIDAVHARGVPVIQVYGATETGPIASYQRIDRAFDTAGSIGRAGLCCDLRLVDAAGGDVGDGEVGEIWVRGDNVLLGYWDNPAATERYMSDGWFRSGDLARRDAEGNYWFTDRLKHVIISGGENIYPAELERVLRGHPGIAAVAVVGRADARWGEVPVAVIERAEGAAALSREDVLALFDGELARYKHPRDVRFVERLPRSALGKLLIDQVRALV